MSTMSLAEKAALVETIRATERELAAERKTLCLLREAYSFEVRLEKEPRTSQFFAVPRLAAQTARPHMARRRRRRTQLQLRGSFFQTKLSNL
jgi:hypothetical protein